MLLRRKRGEKKEAGCEGAKNSKRRSALVFSGTRALVGLVEDWVGGGVREDGLREGIRGGGVREEAVKEERSARGGRGG